MRTLSTAPTCARPVPTAWATSTSTVDSTPLDDCGACLSRAASVSEQPKADSQPNATVRSITGLR